MATQPARPVRLFVYGFLALVLATSGLGVEVWPLTGWRLFSQVRTDTVSGWQVVAVGEGGQESRLEPSSLGRGYRGTSWRLADFPTMPPHERDEVCRVWADGAFGVGAVDSVRIYRTRRPVRTDREQPVPTAARVLRYECGRRP